MDMAIVVRSTIWEVGEKVRSFRYAKLENSRRYPIGNIKMINVKNVVST